MGIDYREMGARIATRRKALGLKQSQVCELCGINDNYLSNIEHARSIPSLEVLMRLCAALDTTPDVMLLGAHRPGQDLRLELSQQIGALDPKQLVLLKSFISWLQNQSL